MIDEHEERFDIKPVGVRYICEFCHEGEMIMTDDNNDVRLAVMTYPPQIKHRCDKCGKEKLLTKSYPYIEWVSVKKEIPEASNKLEGHEIKIN